MKLWNSATSLNSGCTNKYLFALTCLISIQETDSFLVRFLKHRSGVPSKEHCNETKKYVLPKLHDVTIKEKRAIYSSQKVKSFARFSFSYC
jgi:hypothetical protein